ncbi:uncharacterized protein CC84DRAFT_1091190 [Paraphaeosphaeria sporulosa]|uniref:F-box domain-containing protein n=1 Tax=Paraphaeosphaeria sporulosa TaxID=1460663 RepID=A0A177CI08_9PLEO|nr:uncharacterized protein CC84DRAFT_1091190 [Paraphaeosphaeria sporulosa]OAG06460.1 hypothetical protein CC84DRAFT_1091190 [Paraphaeosphaeria sporulosa]
MQTKIERLPQELIDLIVVHLSLQDRQTLRLVSKQLYALTFTTFSNTYFSRRVTTLGVPSLSRLVKTSAHPNLSSCVSLIDVKLLNYEDYGNLREIDRVGIYPPPKRLQRVPQVRTTTGDISQECKLLDYMHTHRDPKAVIHPLSRALKGFRNVKTIRFRVNGLTLYGNPYISAEEEVYQSFLSACFRAVLDAIIRSGVRLQEFTLVKGHTIRPLSKSANLDYSAFNLPVPFLLSLKSAFASLKSLRLSIRTYHNGNSRIAGWEKGISHVIAAASSLEELTICLQATDSKPWFRAAVIQNICRSLELPMLKSLQLYGCVVDELDLIALIKTHASSLQRLLISDTELRSGTWLSILNIFKEDLDLDLLRLQYLQQNAAPRVIRWFPDGIRNSSKLNIDARKIRDQCWMKERLSQAISSLAATAEEHEISEI